MFTFTYTVSIFDKDAVETLHALKEIGHTPYNRHAIVLFDLPAAEYLFGVLRSESKKFQDKVHDLKLEGKISKYEME